MQCGLTTKTRQAESRKCPGYQEKIPWRASLMSVTAQRPCQVQHPDPRNDQRRFAAGESLCARFLLVAWPA
jgi:hypothetical protein